MITVKIVNYTISLYKGKREEVFIYSPTTKELLNFYIVGKERPTPFMCFFGNPTFNHFDTFKQKIKQWQKN